MRRRKRMMVGVLVMLLIGAVFGGCRSAEADLSEKQAAKTTEPKQSNSDVNQQTAEKQKEAEQEAEKERLQAEQERKEEERKQQITELIEAADVQARGYYYEEAIKRLQEAGLEDQAIKDKIRAIEEQKQKLVKYEGPLYHVFFHSLIIDTKKAFDSVGHSAKGYNMWMTTQSEFKKMLPQMLERDYVLYPIKEMVEFDQNGKSSAKDIYLPAGKKPLVISIDDVCYYDYMQKDGFANKLVLNDQGEVVTLVEQEDGQLVETKDGDVMPILDEFVKQHPEFSYRGAKGVIAVTGYQGVFGYRITDLEDYSQEQGNQMLADVKAISNRLRETGWEIACHSYTHNQYFRDASVTMNSLRYDTERWKTKIMPYVGEVTIWISPFGMHLRQGDARLAYLVEQGFTIYCPVGADMKTSYRDKAMIQSRLNLDGYTMLNRVPQVEMFFEIDRVVDPARPAL